MKEADSMAQAKMGDTVKVHYTGKLENNVPFDSSMGADPLEIKLGSCRFIPGFEEAIVGMSPGESKTIKIPPERAYGRYREDRVIHMDKKELPEDIVPQEGMVLEICASNGTIVPVQITEVTKSTVTLDANHPLVEQTLTFEIQLVEIVEGKESGDKTEDKSKENQS
jgi:FKBP-type peptidyl-prolyl cis-trans isomerase 2